MEITAADALATVATALALIKNGLSVGSHIVSTRAGDPIAVRAYWMSTASSALDLICALLVWASLGFDVHYLAPMMVGLTSTAIHQVCFQIRRRVARKEGS